DWYEDGYYRASPPADPPGPSEASYRVIRGGSWSNYAGYCRPATRNRDAPEIRRSALGFRVAAVQE
ncbi:MAG: formylglycine-generating enzyme family protein, partial [Isosphaeraceae bacterium]